MTTAGPSTAAAAAARTLSRLRARPRNLAGTPRGARVQDDRVDVREAPGDLRDGADGGVVTADVDGRQALTGQDEADDLTVDEAVGVTLAILGAVHGRDGGHGQLAAVGTFP